VGCVTCDGQEASAHVAFSPTGVIFIIFFVKIGQNVYGHDTGQFNNWSVSPCLLWNSDSVIVKTPNYTLSGKKWNHSIFAYNFAKCWPIFKNLSPADLAVNF